MFGSDGNGYFKRLNPLFRGLILKAINKVYTDIIKTCISEVFYCPFTIRSTVMSSEKQKVILIK